jgi:hypothetical protein
VTWSCCSLFCTTMMFSLSSWTMRTTTMSMRVSMLLSQANYISAVSRAVIIYIVLKYVQLFFFFALCLFSCMSCVTLIESYRLCVTLIESSHMSCVWHLSNVPYLFTVLRTSSFSEIKKASLVISIEINQINSTLNFELHILKLMKHLNLLVYS